MSLQRHWINGHWINGHPSTIMTKGLIVYIGGMLLPDKNAAAHRIASNASIFRKLGYEVILLGLNRSNGETGNPTRDPTDHYGFECWHMRYPAGSFTMLKHIAGTTALREFLESLLPRRLKAVICYNYPALSQYRIQRLCANNGVRHISDVTEWYDSSGGTFLFRIVKFLDTWFRMKIVHKRSDALITTSEYITRFYADGQDNIAELPTLFDSHAFPSVAPNTDSDDTLKFIYVGRPFEPGRVNPERTNLKERLDKIISAVLAIDTGLAVKLDIYGIDLDEYLAVFPEHKEQLSDKDTRIHFHGYIKNATVRNLIASSDFSVFFRDVNRVNLSGFPTKLSESICCGTPAITTRLPNLVKYESKGMVFLAEPGKETYLLRQITKYSREEIANMKLTCSKSNLFDYRQYIDKVSEFCVKAGL